MTEAVKAPMTERPDPREVQPGSVFEATDVPHDRTWRFRSDGRQWWDATAEVEGYALRYAEDVQAGWQLRRVAEVPLPQQAGFVTMFGCPNLHLAEWVAVLERRDYGDMVSCIGVRPNGEQVAVYLSRAELVQVREDVPA